MISLEDFVEVPEVTAEEARRLTPSERVEVAVWLSEYARDLAIEKIAARHPEYSASDARFALWRMLYGDDLFARAWPNAPMLAP
jgi:hypothetical protein